MKRHFLLLALIAIGSSMSSTASAKYLRVHQEADSRFLTSIERVGPCKVSTPPEPGIRVPSEIYPKMSVYQKEEGTIVLELILDSDWCVRKATVVQSTGYFRLDNVTLEYVMKVKYKPKPESIKQKDGEPTIVIKLGWGASQEKH